MPRLTVHGELKDMDEAYWSGKKFVKYVKATEDNSKHSVGV